MDRPVTHLAISDLAVEFGATRLLGNVTFTVARGERWGIIGRNGSGKTTLFRIISGGLRYSIMEQHREQSSSGEPRASARVVRRPQKNIARGRPPKRLGASLPADDPQVA